jgi:hypothetical protein
VGGAVVWRTTAVMKLQLCGWGLLYMLMNFTYSFFLAFELSGVKRE